MTTETDDLSYYEHELPKVIAGVRRGEKWEYLPHLSELWRQRTDQSVGELLHILFRGNRVRLAPVPVVKWWDCPADVPFPCWIQGETLSGMISMLVVAITDKGVMVNDRSGVLMLFWGELKVQGRKHSTDLRDWRDCVKPEVGK